MHLLTFLLQRTTYIQPKHYNCNTPIIEWLLVYGIYQGWSAIKELFIIITVSTKKERSKRSKDLTELFHCFFCLNFIVAWLVYGNTFHYSSDSMGCKDNFDNYRSLWILMMISIAYGYLIFLIYAMICLLAPCICCAFIAMRNQQER